MSDTKQTPMTDAEIAKIGELCQLLARYLAIIRSLPKTADGVAVAPGDVVYRVPGNRWYETGDEYGGRVIAVGQGQISFDFCSWQASSGTEGWYSSREAAEAAAKKGGA